MKEKQVIVICMLVGLTLLGVGYLLGKTENPDIKYVNVFPENYHTEDMPPVNSNAATIKVTFIDSVDGRPTYKVLLSDSTVLDSMYPEEIANGLVTGDWKYNEDFRITLSN